MNEMNIVETKRFSTCSIDNIKAKLAVSMTDASMSGGNSFVSSYSSGAEASSSTVIGSSSSTGELKSASTGAESTSASGTGSSSSTGEVPSASTGTDSSSSTEEVPSASTVTDSLSATGEEPSASTGTESSSATGTGSSSSTGEVPSASTVIGSSSSTGTESPPSVRAESSSSGAASSASSAPSSSPSTGTLTSTGSPVPTEITDDPATFLGAQNICRRELLGDDFTPLTEDPDLVIAATAYAQTLVNDNYCRIKLSWTEWTRLYGENIFLYKAGVSPFIDDKNFEALSAKQWCEDPNDNSGGRVIIAPKIWSYWSKRASRTFSRVGCGQASVGKMVTSHFGCTIVVCRYTNAKSFSDL
jgi:hypothetical protein